MTSLCIRVPVDVDFVGALFPSNRRFFNEIVAGIRGTKRLVSVNICLVEGNSADIFVSKVSPEILVVKRR